MAEQKAKVVHGPGPRGMGGPRPKVENPGKLLKRIMAEVFQHYLPHCILVLICIVVSALANVQASLFLQTLIDDNIIKAIAAKDHIIYIKFESNHNLCPYLFISKIFDIFAKYRTPL